MDDDGEIRPSKTAGEAVEPRRVVGVAVRADDDLDRTRVDVEPAHVLDHAVGADAGVEQHTVDLATGELDLDER